MKADAYAVAVKQDYDNCLVQITITIPQVELCSPKCFQNNATIVSSTEKLISTPTMIRTTASTEQTIKTTSTSNAPPTTPKCIFKNAADQQFWVNAYINITDTIALYYPKRKGFLAGVLDGISGLAGGENFSEILPFNLSASDTNSFTAYLYDILKRCDVANLPPLQKLPTGDESPASSGGGGLICSLLGILGLCS